jgi:Sulfatase
VDANLAGKSTGDFFKSIAHVDRNLGRLRQCLMDEGLIENTVLIFLTDNGTAGGDRVFNAGMRGRKGSPYDGGHRVPCFLSWPNGGFPTPSKISHLSAHIDLLPTLVDLCGLSLPKPVKFDGMSLNSLFANNEAKWPQRVLVMGSGGNKSGPNAPPPIFGTNCAVMTERWRLVNDCELYDLNQDPGQRRNIAAENPEQLNRLRKAYQIYWADVSMNDSGWRGRPVIGTKTAPETHLCAEEWFSTRGNCPWNQGAIANGVAATGYWTVRFAEAGNYRVEVRRWPQELETAIVGIPTGKKIPDAWMNGKPVVGTLYQGNPRALPVSRVELQVGDQIHKADVGETDSVKVFKVAMPAGPAKIEATFLDEAGKALCGAYYVSIKRE